MRTSKIYGRIKKIEVSITTDTGETISVSMTGEQLSEMPGIDSIHSVGTVFSHNFAHHIEDWVLDNPVETPYIAALRSGKYSLPCRSKIERPDGGKYVLELYDAHEYERKKFYYDSLYDARDDLDYAEKKFKRK